MGCRSGGRSSDTRLRRIWRASTSSVAVTPKTNVDLPAGADPQKIITKYSAAQDKSGIGDYLKFYEVSGNIARGVGVPVGQAALKGIAIGSAFEMGSWFIDPFIGLGGGGGAGAATAGGGGGGAGAATAGTITGAGAATAGAGVSSAAFLGKEAIESGTTLGLGAMAFEALKNPYVVLAIAGIVALVFFRKK